MARIRIAVAVAKDGSWEASGADTEGEKSAMDNAICWLIERGSEAPMRTFWIEADVEPASHEARTAVSVVESEPVDF
jgi:hypothetical protein